MITTLLNCMVVVTLKVFMKRGIGIDQSDFEPILSHWQDELLTPICLLRRPQPSRFALGLPGLQRVNAAQTQFQGVSGASRA
jgi:hypothetical protein